MTERVQVTQRTSTTRYCVGPDALTELRAWLEPLPLRVPVIADPDVWRLYGDAVATVLHPCEPLVFHVAGEEQKEFGTVERLASELSANHVHRREKLILLGGGVVCDVGGLTASLYMRGLGYAIVATSLMAQIDAAIGGKVVTNFDHRKNLIGGFHHPELVLADPSFLRTLPPRHVRAALAEALKVGLILPELQIESMLEGAVASDPAAMGPLVERCVDGKLSLLEPDPFERDLDRVLNLGHAVAHALEKVEDCELIHGEAVAIGLAATARYASAEGICTSAYAGRILDQLVRLGLPTTADVPELELRARLGDIVDHRGGRIRLVVPTGDAGVTILEHADLDALAVCARRRARVRT
ncbi:MAG TPA: 3-dehydroquinate synthase family protein [Thermoleophilaceae bacterium]|jgi:3-dehydroquinate synthase